MTPDPCIERMSQRPLRALCAAAHVKRQAAEITLCVLPERFEALRQHQPLPCLVYAQGRAIPEGHFMNEADQATPDRRATHPLTHCSRQQTTMRRFSRTTWFAFSTPRSSMFGAPPRPNLSIEQTSSSGLCPPEGAAHVKR